MSRLYRRKVITCLWRRCDSGCRKLKRSIAPVSQAGSCSQAAVAQAPAWPRNAGPRVGFRFGDGADRHAPRPLRTASRQRAERNPADPRRSREHGASSSAQSSARSWRRQPRAPTRACLARRNPARNAPAHERLHRVARLRIASHRRCAGPGARHRRGAARESACPPRQPQAPRMQRHHRRPPMGGRLHHGGLPRCIRRRPAARRVPGRERVDNIALRGQRPNAGHPPPRKCPLAR